VRKKPNPTRLSVRFHSRREKCKTRAQGIYSVVCYELLLLARRESIARSARSRRASIMCPPRILMAGYCRVAMEQWSIGASTEEQRMFGARSLMLRRVEVGAVTMAGMGSEGI